jgi:phosphatidylglycerol---prolipoprotein diacylglyceryl transferase
MFPDFQYLLESIFHAPFPAWLSLFKTFGFFVALAFIGAAWYTAAELRRKEQLGSVHYQLKTIVIGQGLKAGDLIVNIVGGFLVGDKIGGLFTYFNEASPNPLGYLLSLKGNVFLGVLGGVALGLLKYLENRKQRLPEPVEKKVAVYPHQLITEIVVVAAFGGLIGAKIFNALETWDDFVHDPLGNLFSSSGLTFYGGLIVAAIAFYYYARRHNITFSYLCDATAPGLMLAYGIGRLGCQFAGDGDWGIFNTAYVSNPDASLRLVARADSSTAMQLIHNAAHAYTPAPAMLPRWLVAMNYAHNINNEGVAITGCTGSYCSMLPVSVYPTPIYEAVVCIGLFFVLWAIRKRFTYAFQLFGVYLIFNGIERFFVELIRVNTKYDFGFIHPTQAEIISVVMVIVGVALQFYRKETNLPRPLTTEAKAMVSA